MLEVMKSYKQSNGQVSLSPTKIYHSTKTLNGTKVVCVKYSPGPLRENEHFEIMSPQAFKALQSTGSRDTFVKAFSGDFK